MRKIKVPKEYLRKENPNFRGNMGLLKSGSREHMESLHREGRVYMNTLDFFRNAEAGNGRTDPHEGVGHFLQGEGVEIEFGGMKFDSSNGLVDVQLTSARSACFNVFCMFAPTITPAVKLGRFNVDLESLGDTVVAIMDPAEFSRRMDKALEKYGTTARAPVEYVDRATYSGPMGPFRKFNEYAYQTEYRFLLDRGVDVPEPFALELGSLEDISVIADATKVAAGLCVEHKEMTRQNARRRLLKQQRSKRKRSKRLGQ